MVAVRPYTVQLAQGWNLISFPGTPVQSDLGRVFPLGCGVSVVLAYRNGDWETAVQEENGLWRGNLNAVQAGYGYWVHASQHTTFAVGPLASPLSASLTGVANLAQGWNLVGVLDSVDVLDVELRPLNDATNTYSLDMYLEGIPWRVAYGYSAVPAGWFKATPGDDSPVWTGFGYWVWIGGSPTRLPEEPPALNMGLGKDASTLGGSGYPPLN